jgi:hypothetical protein
VSQLTVVDEGTELHEGNSSPTGALPENGDLSGISSEKRYVALYPSQSQNLVHQPHVTGHILRLQ